MRSIRSGSSDEGLHTCPSPNLTLGDLGEKALLARLLPRLHGDDRLATGIGHDAAVIELGAEFPLIAMKIDRAAKPVALSRGWAGPASWGRMAVAANCSDLLGTGATPRAFMLSLILPADWPEEDFNELVLGAEAECRRLDVIFAGGDTKQGSEAVVVGAAIGTFASSRPLSRSGAREGDAVVVAGEVGGFLGAYLLLAEGVAAPAVERRAWMTYLSHPVARWEEGLAMATRDDVVAAVDTSDGMYDAFVELASRDLGIHLDLASVPFHPFAIRCANLLGLPLRNFLFAGGDWNLVYAVRGSLPRQVGPGLSLHTVGHFTRAPGMTAVDDGVTYSFSGPRGEHFRGRLEDGAVFTRAVVDRTWYRPNGA